MDVPFTSFAERSVPAFQTNCPLVFLLHKATVVLLLHEYFNPPFQVESVGANAKSSLVAPGQLIVPDIVPPARGK